MTGRRGRSLLAFAAVLTLAGCATPEARVRAGLVDAGVAPRVAACMAERMVDRLSLLQLRRLGRLPGADDARNLDQLLHRVRALGDPEIVSVTASSGAICWLRGG